ncbi:TIGR04222 domain-containing membrane protein [Streptomyces sp. H27-D2]|uniref:TIGR04222 domain-containing membrane protein n=1 Tax=Streptomyces sp. H27-D2 TaxID=3046304 RepID=UPI002DBFCF49|nr:TIGR04222 domain-containing membrane protein [Streptomyces sp. H27-D2]MEC4019962.1 TIGR04222 domain-containing membrane protein [Streptomyces sp. H27-D2]
MWLLFLFVAWTVTLLSCGRLCRAAITADRSPQSDRTSQPDRDPAAGPRRLTLYETAFLAGGPRRVAELTLVSMARQRRLLLAHTGWATVVNPEGRDELERSLITAIGPEGQCRIPAVRAALATADAVAALADRLVAAGFAVPAAARAGVSTAVRQVRAAGGTVLLCGAAAVMMVPPEGGRGPVIAWFALPLVLITGCLAIARVEVHPSAHWASPAGQLLLIQAAVPHQHRPGHRPGHHPPDRSGPSGRSDPPDRSGRSAAPDPSAASNASGPPGPPGPPDTELLTALAVRGPTVVADPDLRAALNS